MKTITRNIRFFIVLFLFSTMGSAQEVFSTVGIVGTATPEQDWDESTPMQLQDPADPHQWMLTVRLYEGELKFRANNSWDVNWGGGTLPTGTAHRGGLNLVIQTAGYYTIYFNDVSGNFHFESLNPVTYQSIGLVGDATANGWNTSTAMAVNPDDPHLWHLESIVLTDGSVKFRANNNWDVSWGGSGFPQGVASHSAPDLSVPAGEYSVTFNDVTGAYLFRNLDPPVYETVGIIGTATTKDWEASTPMERSQEDPHIWTLTTFLKVGELKFRANDAWEVDWGGETFPTGTAVVKAKNFYIPKSGYYQIHFNDYTRHYQFIKISPDPYTSVGILGTATAGQWNHSTPMVQGENPHTWTLENFELSAGVVKFRANNSWDINWGGSDFPTGVAVPKGYDIPVTPGIYHISFNDFTREYHFELVESSPAGIVTLDPPFPTADEPVRITYDPGQGVSDLLEAEKIYMHSGVVLSAPEGTAWHSVVGNWGQDDGVGQMQPVPGDPGKWQITLPSIREYYDLEPGIPVFRLAMVFRNADGSLMGKSETDGDIFVNTDPGDYVRFTQPVASEVFGLPGEPLPLEVEASGVADHILVEVNEGPGFRTLSETTGSEITHAEYPLGVSGLIQFRVTAQIGDKTVSSQKEMRVHLRQPTKQVALPEGMHNGINYDPEDPTKATLVLLAPEKEFVYLVGDFNNWEIRQDFQMNQTPDGEYFWLEVDGLEPQKEYVYQYWVEGTIKIGDPYADQVADPYSDSHIPAAVYPNPVSYNRTDNGIATVLQTGQQAYQWNYPEVVGGRPDKEDLVIYELLVRDFVASHSYQEAIEKLPYLKELGVNAIELLPVMEFENNESWGYNPTYLFAPDKYYGTKNDLKAFVDKAHELGMVVLLDMVHNHQFGQSPMVRMYFDEALGQPAADSPWFNPQPTHPFNVGYDFNHESPYTQAYIDDVNRYWLEEYHFDGYRFDLTKGFTQRNTFGDVEAWSAYDQSRIDILKRMTDKIWETDPQAYVIMEHLADNSEEKVLADYGIMLWGNMNHQYGEVVLGNHTADLNWALSSTREWSAKNLVAYMESHDEERLMVKALEYGMHNAQYDIKELETALERVKLASAFYYTVPGPKMIWQFGELGYDIPIDFNGRTGNKPLPWGEADGLHYHEDPERMKLYKSKAALINLVNDFSDVFEEGDFSWTPSGQLRKISIHHSQMNVLIVGNFGLSEGSTTLNFAHPGTWYDFYSGQAFEVGGTEKELALSPGEFHVLVDQPVDFPQPDITSNTFVYIETPTLLTAQSVAPSSIELQWQENSAGETGYAVERRSEGDEGFVTIAILEENANSYRDQNIVDGRTYQYRVRALSSSEEPSDWSNTAWVDLPLLAPDHLTAVLADTRAVSLHWQDNSSNETHYVLFRSIEHGEIATPFMPIAELPANTTAYRDQDIRPGMEYHYQVQAKDSDEDSDLSNRVSIRPAEGMGDQLAKSIRMYPNPASERVVVSTDFNIRENALFYVVSLQGTVVASFELSSENRSVELITENLPSGVYIVHSATSETAFGKLLLIQHE